MDEKEIQGHKQQYNEYLKRHYKAMAVLDDNKIPMEQREKWIPDYQKVLNELNFILNLFDTDRIKYTPDEVFGGFQI